MNYIPNNVSDCVTEASLALEKGLLILGDLTTEYPFDGDKAKHIKTWVYEYSRITTFMGIACDYMFEAAQMIKRAEEITSA